MAWIPDSNWLKALDIKASSAAAVTASCAVVLGMSKAGILHLDVLPDWVKAVIAVAGIFAFAILAAKMWDWGAPAFNQHKARKKHEETVLGYLDTLDKEENAILARLLKEDQQSLHSLRTHGPLATLAQKGLIVPGRAGALLDWPFVIPNFVWAELQERREEFTG